MGDTEIKSDSLANYGAENIYYPIISTFNNLIIRKHIVIPIAVNMDLQMVNSFNNKSNSLLQIQIIHKITIEWVKMIF